MPHSKPHHDILQSFSVDQTSGLTEEQIALQKKKYGLNILAEAKQKSYAAIFLSQLKSPVVYLLLGAALISFFFKDYPEAIAIAVVILINAAIGFIMEAQAVNSMNALKKLDKVFTKVIRNKQLKEIPSEEVVPGDILFIEAGDMLAADARLVDVSNLEVDESSLTGESVPVPKVNKELPHDTSLAEKNNMVFKGTAATRGTAKAVVTATGMSTELGHISSMVQSAATQEIPLNEKLEKFSKKLIWLTVIIMVPFIATGWLEGRELYKVIETAIALAVAAIPEGLPIVATIALARGMLKLAKHQVIVKKLAAVETLGSTNVIFTDKTGTLTENRLTVSTICVPDVLLEMTWNESAEQFTFQPGAHPHRENENFTRLIEIGVLCNNASFSKGNEVGDPLEVALLKVGAYYEKGFIEKFKSSFPRLKEKPFDSESKVMATLHHSRLFSLSHRRGTESGALQGEAYYTAAKGAAEELLGHCTHILKDGQVFTFSVEEKKEWLGKTDLLAKDGLKVLAFAYKQTDTEPHQLLSSLVFTGLAGFLDPPRSEVPDAVRECKSAGVKVIMVTGDHPATARNIAMKVGITDALDARVMHGRALQSAGALSDAEEKKLMDTLIFSRVTPAQKLELVTLYQKKGFIVAMTGDGVNDAPALKQADIGVAMGRRGTQVAREAADMVLQDDSFTSIEKAIKQGRVIFSNIRTFVIYLLSCNLSEILVVSIAAFTNVALPLQPLQILFLNIVTDVFPALALGMGRGNPSVMRYPPRKPDEPVLTRSNWLSIATYAFVITLSVFSVFLYCHWYRGYSAAVCNNVAFFTLALAQLLHPLNMIPPKENFFSNDIITNPHLWLAVAFCISVLAAVYLIPATSAVLSLTSVPHELWMFILGASMLPVVIIQLLKRTGVIE